MPPKVSVIICSYNAGAYLEWALISVLNQSYHNIEVLLVDDGSTDGSFDFVPGIGDERVRVLAQKNAGKSVALNRALDEASGEFYAIHDADDISHPSRIQRQVEALEEDSGLAAVFCGHDLILGEKHYAPRFRARSKEECNADIERFVMPAHDPTAMFRMSAVRDFRYEPALRIGQGYDYILRVGEQYPMSVLGECLYSYRVHMTSITKRAPGKREEMVSEVLRRACERRGLSFEETFPGRGDSLESNRVRDNGLAVDFMESVVDLRRAGRWSEAISNGISCAGLCPVDPYYYKALLYALLPERIRRRLRTSENDLI